MTAQIYYLPGVPHTAITRRPGPAVVHFTQPRPFYSSRHGRIYDRDADPLSLAAVRLRLWDIYDVMRRACLAGDRPRFDDYNERLAQLMLARLTAQRWRLRYGVAV